MRQRTRRAISRRLIEFKGLVLALAVLVVALLPVSVFADTGPVCQDTDFAILGGLGLCEGGIPALLEVGSNILAGLVGVVAVGGLVWAGILYASADGSAEQVAKAKGMIRNVVIGLVVFALIYTATNFLIPGGVFTTTKAKSTTKDKSTMKAE